MILIQRILTFYNKNNLLTEITENIID